MKKRKIHRPHWKRIVKAAQRKLSEARREKRYEHLQPSEMLMHGVAVHKAAVESIMETAREAVKTTKAQKKWYSRGFEEARSVIADREIRLREEIARLNEKQEKHHQRQRLVQPLIQFIERMMED